MKTHPTFHNVLYKTLAVFISHENQGAKREYNSEQVEALTL
jgi:hypothetical protein